MPETARHQSTDFLEDIRVAELTLIKDLLAKKARPGARVLEIGAGTGWQARALASLGYQVTAIDIPDSNHRHARIWPIIDFDGTSIPFPDRFFDVVYSSNVLEHVHALDDLNREIVRVLRSDGFAAHYVPTAAWRAWSLLAFYPALVREAWRRFRHLQCSPASGGNIGSENSAARPQRPLLQKLVRRVIPHAHGIEGSCFGELRRFQRHTWDSLFCHEGWEIEAYDVNGLYLSGEMLLGRFLPVSSRKFISKALGSSAHLYVLRVPGP